MKCFFCETKDHNSFEHVSKLDPRAFSTKEQFESKYCSTPETTTLSITMNDRLKRRIIFLLNNDQKCVTGSWIENDPDIKYDTEIDNTQLYALLTQVTKNHLETKQYYTGTSRCIKDDTRR